MIKPENINRLKLIELYSKKIARGLLLGASRSTVKGQGFDFDQIREYQQGDDVRSIDWNSTARMNKVLVKQCKEEKTRTIIIALDISWSTFFGSTQVSKSEAALQVAGIIASVGIYAQDRVGLLLFSDSVEEYVPPMQGSKALRIILDRIFSARPVGKRTNITAALRAIDQIKQKDMMVFLISDFIAQDFSKPLAHLAIAHDVMAFCLTDPFEVKMAPIGFLHVRDSESEAIALLDIRDGKQLNSFLEKRYNQIRQILRSSGVDCAMMLTVDSAVQELVQFFKKRRIR